MIKFFVLVFLLAVICACAERPINVETNVICPQPPAATLSPAERLTAVPALPGDDPSAVIGVLSETIVKDTETYGNEVDKRETLVQFGVERCGWTR
jgi:hypothetical protein